MNITAPRPKLLAAAAATLAAAGADARGCIEATEDGEITVTAAGKEGGASIPVQVAPADVTVRKPGHVVMPLAPVASVLRSARDAEVSIDGRADSSRVILRTESSRFEFPAGQWDEVPFGPPSLDGSICTVSTADFRRAVARVAFAVDRRPNPSNWATTGVHVEATADGLTLVATDTFRQSVVSIPYRGDPPDGSKLPAMALLAARTIKAWAESARSCEVLALTLGPNTVVCSGGSPGLWGDAEHQYLAWASPLPGTFPPWRDLMNRSRPHSMKVTADELFAAVELALVAADPDEGIDPRERRVTLQASPGRLTVSSGSSEHGAGRVEVPASGYDGEPFAVPLDGRRLAEYLASLSGGQVMLSVRWSGPAEPVGFMDEDGGAYLAMPLVDREGT